MSSLVVVGFPNAQEAEEVRIKLAQLQTEHLIALEDAVVVSKDSEGHVKLNQAINLTATGAVSGGFWGTLVGLLFLNPLAGAAIGAAAGALSGSLSDIGINDDFLREVGETLQVGSAALCLLIREATPDRILKELRVYAKDARILQTNLSFEDEENLKAALEKAKAEAQALRLN
ncbi:DUF1269 domain-containing protein [Synechococcus elongatus]|uniref:DUF1269 domain-containing protein n=1 Tax=Synechococcus elongatus TaxID=32046 RepID=UPI0030CD9B3C